MGRKQLGLRPDIWFHHVLAVRPLLLSIHAYAFTQIPKNLRYTPPLEASDNTTTVQILCTYCHVDWCIIRVIKKKKRRFTPRFTKPATRNPNPETVNPEPSTLNPEPQTLNSKQVGRKQLGLRPDIWFHHVLAVHPLPLSIYAYAFTQIPEKLAVHPLLRPQTTQRLSKFYASPAMQTGVAFE